MKTLLRAYLYAALGITTTAVIACFYWYIPEYYAAVSIDKTNPERAHIHRTNALCPLYQQRSPLVSKKPPGGAADEQ